MIQISRVFVPNLQAQADCNKFSLQHVTNHKGINWNISADFLTTKAAYLLQVVTSGRLNERVIMRYRAKAHYSHMLHYTFLIDSKEIFTLYYCLKGEHSFLYEVHS